MCVFIEGHKYSYMLLIPLDMIIQLLIYLVYLCFVKTISFTFFLDKR